MLATDAVAVDGSAVAGAVGAQCGSAGPEEQAFRGFVTANTTGARNLKEFLKCTRADVVCAQELRVAGDKARSLVNWAHWNGWKAIVNDGMVSEETGWLSAGVGIFARSHLGLGHPQGGPARTTDGRAVAAVVEIPGLPQMLVVAAYFRVGEKVSVGNLELMKEVGQWCAVRKMPFLIGADWNMSPNEVAGTSFAESLGGAIVADTSVTGTCVSDSGASCIDFFRVSRDIAEAASSVEIAPNAVIPTHNPVQLTIKAKAADLRKYVVSTPHKILVEAVFGPRPPLPAWDEARRLASAAVKAAQRSPSRSVIKFAVTRAYLVWAQTAEMELADATGVELPDDRRRRGQHFKGRLVPLLGTGKAAPCPVGMARRWIARRARDILKACRANDPQLAEAYMTGEAAEALEWFQRTGATEELGASFRGVMAAAKRVVAAAVQRAAQGVDMDSDEAECDDVDEMQAFIAAAEEAADEAERKDSIADRASWTDWVAKALHGGGGAAHRFVKGPEAWQPASAVVEGEYAVAPGNLLLAEQARCEALWVTPDEAGKDDVSFVPPADRVALPRLTVEQIRAAGAATPVKKAVAYDGIHPRHVTLLSDRALKVLGALWEAIETAAVLPKGLEVVMAPLIPKKSGHRDIALFPGIVRVCTKARVPICQQWERANDRDYFAAGQARGAPDVVWRTSVKCGAAVANRLEAGAVLWDMTAFFQMIRHGRLLNRAAEAGFNVGLARLAISLYRCERRLTLSGEVAQEGVSPNRGVAPGCSFATTMVKIYGCV